MTTDQLDDIIEDIMTSTWDSGRTKIINLCQQMCDRQKEICAKNAVVGAYVKSQLKNARYKKWNNNKDVDSFSTIQMYKVEKKSILLSPYPEELL